jgi:archaellum component FlaC
MDGVICEEKECPVAIMKEEIERLKEKVKGFQELWCEAESDLRTARAEAVKEFVEKFENKIKDVQFTLGQSWEIKCALKDVVKEMTEGT